MVRLPEVRRPTFPMRIAIDPIQVSKNFAVFKDNAALQESAQLYSRGLPVAEMIQALAMNQKVLPAFAAFSGIYPGGNLERALLEKVILSVSRSNACQFCVNSHLDISKALGIAHSGVTDPKAPEHSMRERLAMEYAAAIRQDSNRIPEGLYERLHKSFSDSEVVELTWFIGFINLLNWFNNALDVRYHGEFEGLHVA